MIDWGKKKNAPQAAGIQIGPRVKSGGSSGAKPVMSKAGTPMQAPKPKPPVSKARNATGYSHPTTRTAKPRKTNPRVR
jgi:hypothetical protein